MVCLTKFLTAERAEFYAERKEKKTQESYISVRSVFKYQTKIY